MRYLSTFSGIEAASVAWEPLGWEPVGFSEIDPFASAVLAHRFPNVRNYGDVTKHESWGVVRGSVDLLVGGSPCQAFSVAGLRKGLDDPRGQLTLVYLQLAARLRPRWIVWENVPGVLSADGGRAFGAFLGGLAELGYGFAWRVLDARHFGVPQRRRRVFLVAHDSGDWERCATVLLEPEGVRGDHPPSGKAGQEASRGAGCGPDVGGVQYGGTEQSVSDTVTAKWSKGSGGPSGSECGLYVAHPSHPDVAPCVDGQTGGTTLCNQAVDSGAFIPMTWASSSHAQYAQGIGTIRAAGGDLGGGSETLVTAIQGNLIGRDVGGPEGVGVSSSGDMYTLTTADVHGVAIPIQDGVAAEKGQNGLGVGDEGDPAYTMDTRGAQAIAYRKAKRAQSVNDDETWVEAETANTLNGFDVGDVRTTHAVCYGVDSEFNAVQDGMGTLKREGQGGTQQFVAFAQNQRGEVRDLGDQTGALSGPGTHQTTHVAVAVDLYNQTIDGDIAATVTSAVGGTNTSGPKVIGFAENFHAIKVTDEVPCMTTSGCSPTQNAGGFGILEAVAFKTGNSAKARSIGASSENAPTLASAAGGNTVPAIAFSSNMSEPDIRTDDCSPCVKLGGHGGGNPPAVLRSPMIVRRLTPIECERLQGFPDDWTRIPYRKKDSESCPDGPRYKALGNSMAVPCMAWIGRRIQLLEEGRL